MTAGLWRWSVFAAMLSFAGLPIYIHAPKFYVDEYGVGLAAMGIALGLLRLVDVVQDPRWAGSPNAGAGAGRLGAGGRHRDGGGDGRAVRRARAHGARPVVRAVAPRPLQRLLPADDLLLRRRRGPRWHHRPAGPRATATWREGGALLGVCLAAVAPAALMFTGAPFTAFAASLPCWSSSPCGSCARSGAGRPPQAPDWRAVLADPIARRLLILAMVNGAPVAVTSTLFLYFVESRLMAPAQKARSSSCSSFRPPHPPPPGASWRKSTARNPCCWPGWSCRSSPSPSP